MNEPHIRRQAIPILYTRGSHYEVGFDMGRTFGSMIRNLQTQCQILNHSLLPLYNTPKGKKIYDETLASVKASFPQYILELQGVADGAEVEFEHLFLRQMDAILPQNMLCPAAKASCGCSSIILNQKHCRVMGHTEDALIETMNQYYFVVAHIINDQPQGKYKVKEERFMSLCYAGLLPGYTFSENHHGLVFTINTICAKNLRSGRTPRTFITRALLASCNMDDVLRVVIDEGVGAADACSINLAFLNDPRKMCYNMEFAPCPQGKNKSKVCLKEIPVGTYNYHFNKFEGLSLDETDDILLQSSEARKEAMKSYKPPVSGSDVRNMLGDVSGDPFNVWMDKCTDVLRTICVALFDLNARTLSLFSDNPSSTEPVCILPLLEK